MKSRAYDWWKNATAEERAHVAAAAGLTVQSTKNQIIALKGSSDVANGMKPASAAQASKAMRELRVKNNAQDRLPNVTRGELSVVCAACPYYQLCKRADLLEQGEQEVK